MNIIKNWYKLIFYSFIILIFFSNNTYAFESENFENNNLVNWTYSEYDTSNSHYAVTNLISAYSSYYGCNMYSAKNAGYAQLDGSLNVTNIDTVSFRYNVITSSGSGTYFKVNIGYTWILDISTTTEGWQVCNVDVSALSGNTIIRLYARNAISGGVCNVYIDDIMPYYQSPKSPLLNFTNKPIEVTTYAHLECNLDDYWNTHANEHFYLSYDYYYKNISNYTIIDYNELELNSQNTINLIPTYYPYFNQTGGCEIKASILYTYHDPVYTEEELGGIGYYVSTVLVNSTYESPEEPEEPEEPEIPDPEPEPEPEPNPPVPPTQPNGTGANQSINVSWAGEYYIIVNDTFSSLCSPIYNFTNWSLSPVHSLNSSIGEFNYHMNESFTQTEQDSSILYDSINTIYGAIHPKIRNVITYYLIWVVLLIILKKD